MKQITIVFSLAVVVLCRVLAPASSPGANNKGWTKAEAMSKAGKRVQYDGGSALLQWGPIRKGGVPTFRKPVGRGVKAGSTGTVTDIVKDGERGYEVIVEWDPDPEENEVWESGLYKDNYGLVIELAK